MKDFTSSHLLCADRYLIIDIAFGKLRVSGAYEVQGLVAESV